ncbi:actin [Stylonychia lemnae]|uniref:Actin, cytoplasmic n=1 Tax=Stylonychia lemnae TaxID=5949 RepID=A0A078AS62_STYLE|nr:actin [Stylonychia lemnae]|eukprot:CDW84057.1 actin [Stylonychia lemnae]
MDEEVSAIVIDNGSRNLRIGYAGDEIPRQILQNIVRRRKMSKFMTNYSQEQKDVYYCDENKENKALFTNSYPIERGVIKHWEDQEQIWSYAVRSVLKTQFEDHPLLMTEIPVTSKQYREKITQIVFEQFNVPCFYLSQSSVLSLYASGRTSGLVVDSGETHTTFSPIHEGYQFYYATQKVNLGGRDLTQYILKELNQKGSYRFNMESDEETINEIKEKNCYVVLDYEEYESQQRQANFNSKPYELPDGKVIQVNGFKAKAPEILFNPAIAKINLNGMHQYSLDTILACEQEYRKDVYQNIILSGGNTLFEGIGERMCIEMRQIASSTQKVKILAPPERKYSAWQGASILSALSTFQTMWINKQEYDESGPAVIHRKCF